MGESDKNDPAYCRRRAADFRAKARAASGWLMKQALQAAAHEYELRAEELEHTSPVTQAIFPKPAKQQGTGLLRPLVA